MNIKGLDYNTDRESMRLPEYGRGIHTMIEHALAIENAAERQRCAETIVKIMRKMHPELRNQPDSNHKLWDHLAIMSNFQLDIKYPYDITSIKEPQRPAPLAYPKQALRVRHYGAMVFQMIDKLLEMEHGEAYDRLLALTANQMKRDLIMWGHTSSSEERVADDIMRFTDGKIKLKRDFKFEHVQISSIRQQGKKKKK